MKVFIESQNCDFLVRVHFTVTNCTFPVAHIDRLFNYEGYVHVSHTLNNGSVELDVTPDMEHYLLPPDLNEIELLLNGEEAVLTDHDVTQKMLQLLAYANDNNIKVQVLSHHMQEFSINKRVLPNITKAMKDTRKHLEIQQQAIGTTYTSEPVYFIQTEYMRTRSLPDDCTRARADYVKKKAREYHLDEQRGVVMWKIPDEDCEKEAITSAAMLEEVVCTSLATSSPLCSRGQNVRNNLAVLCDINDDQKAYARIEERYHLIGIRAPLRVKAKTNVRRQTKQAKRRTCQRMC